MLPGLMKGLARFLAVLLFLLPVNSFSLGLGEINLRSALNQSLDAEVALMSIGNVAPEDIVVKLASKEAFDQAGIDRPFFLTKFKFKVAKRDNGDFYLKITSHDPVKEPFLDFIVEANWPSGRVLREYTLLLDPPVLVDERSGALDIPLSEASAPEALDERGSSQGTAAAASTAAPAASTAAPRFASRASAVSTSEGGEISYGPVQTTDTLWSIASRIKPSRNVTVQQVMIALLSENPEAFDHGNINDLKAGYFLRISDAAIISDVSAIEAELIAKEHYEAWVDAKQSAALAAGQRPLGASGRSGGGSGAGEPRLKLMAPDESGSQAGSGSSLGAVSGDIREELAFALEAADISRQENEELRNRLAALEEQLASMQRLITLKDDTLTAMQVSPEELAAAEASLAQMTESGLPDDAELEVASTDEEIAAADAQQSETAIEQPGTPPPVAVPPAPPVESSIIDDIFGMAEGMLGGIDPMLALGGVAVVVLLAGAMVVRRRKVAAAMDEAGDLGTDIGSAGEGGALSEAASEGSDEAVASVLNDAIPDYSNSAGGVDVTDDDEIDAIAEADVYLAYRRFDKAEELLNEAVQNEPDRHDLQVKLLEVYAAGDKKDEFIDRAEKLRSSLGGTDNATWKNIAEMGAKIAPTSLLFSDDADADVDSTGVSDELDVELPDLNGDLDLDGFDFDSDSQTDVAPEPETISDNPFDDVSSGELNLDDLGVESGDSLDLSDVTSSSDDPFDGLDDLGDLEASLDSALDMMSDDTTDALPDLDVDSLNASSSGDAAVVENEAALNNEFDFDEVEEATSDAGDALDLSDVAAESPEETLSLDDSALEFSGDEIVADGGKDVTASTDVNDLSVAGESEPDSSVDAVEAAAEGTDDALGLPDEAVTETVTDNIEEDLFAGLEEAGSDNKAADGDDWLSELSNDISSLDDELGDLDDSELFSAEDEVGTKLDLARAYIDMGDNDSAKGILDEVVSDGSDEQKRDANELIERIT